MTWYCLLITQFHIDLQYISRLFIGSSPVGLYIGTTPQSENTQDIVMCYFSSDHQWQTNIWDLCPLNECWLGELKQSALSLQSSVFTWCIEAWSCWHTDNMFCFFLLFNTVSALSQILPFWHLCLPSISLLCGQKKKKGSIEENEENCNLNIHKALCLFPPICVRERSCYSAVDFWQLPSHCNLSVSKVTPVLLRSTSDLNITVRLGEDADRLGTAEADIISLSLNSSTPRHLSTVN